MERITNRHLQAVVDRINTSTNSPMEPYTATDHVGAVVSKANIGNFHLDYAYGGVALHRMVSKGGSIKDVFNSGHITKRDLYHRMHAFMTGLETRSSK